MAIIGIDLGTTNSLAAVWRNHHSELIPNAAGEYLTPSAVSVDEDGAILTGRAAKERLVSHPERSAAGFKRDMGTGRKYHLGGHVFSPEELSSFILRALREDAERYLGEPVMEAVVSVPAYFAEGQRAATKRAAALAGLRVERLINEPSAAAVAGERLSDGEQKTALVFDFGGGTLDVSLVEMFDNVVSVAAVSGDIRLGGRDFDLAIARAFCQECGLTWNQLSARQRGNLLYQAEICKMALSGREPVLMSVMDGEISASLIL
ncbi:MAG: Hsp70 family protein, partial [Oscillibacter sp.]|nr:Hsp70 family protein [Oscillibacter sp.]